MKGKLLAREWDKLFEETLPEREFKRGDSNWILSLFGWKKDAS